MRAGLLALAGLALLAPDAPLSAQSVFDTLSRSQFTDHWLILPGKDGCGATYRPPEGTMVINGQPSFDVKRAGGSVLSFSPRQAGPEPHPLASYTVSIGGRQFEASGAPWRDGAAGLRLDMPATSAEMLASGGELVVRREDRTVLAFQFEHDAEFSLALRKCLEPAGR